MSQLVENCIDRFPEEFKSLAFQTHYLLLEAAPGVRSSVKYGFPFYDYLGNFAYMAANKYGLELCLTKGYMIEMDPTFLDQRDRKRVKSISLKDESVLEDERFFEALQQAFWLNENWKEIKAKAKRRKT